MVGPDASALLSTIAVAVKAKMTDRELAQVVFAHPTTSWRQFTRLFLVYPLVFYIIESEMKMTQIIISEETEPYF